MTDRCNLKTVTASADRFVTEFVDRIPILLLRSFIASQQNSFLNDRKRNLQKDEALLICDFPENYRMVVRDVVQAFHWMNIQATVHPFAIHLKHASSDSVQFCSFSIISGCEVRFYNSSSIVPLPRLIFKNKIRLKKEFISLTEPSLSTKLNKIFCNLVFHEADFGVAAERHFFAIARGKSPYDDTGETSKKIRRPSQCSKTSSRLNINTCRSLQLNATERERH